MAKTTLSRDIESVLHGAWLIDIDSKRGSDALKKVMKRLPAAPFLRATLATHFLVRVYWSHWKREDKIALLEAAEETIKSTALKITNKAEILRRIDQSATGEETYN
jgi:hypothetical protein